MNPTTTATNATRDRPVAPQTLMHTARFAWYQPLRLAIVCLTGRNARGRMAESVPVTPTAAGGDPLKRAPATLC